jgi:hypothetical protein
MKCQVRDWEDFPEDIPGLDRNGKIEYTEVNI